jgi:hypothetical protein
MAGNGRRTIVYVDGFNLYYGLRDSGYRDCYWLDIRAFATRLASPTYLLAATKYFTARVSGPRPGDSPEKAIEREASRVRQQTYLEALGTLRTVEIFEGRYLLKRDHCRVCKADFLRPEEKMTDVCIATELVADAFLNRFDSAMIVSGDADLIPPIVMVKNHFPDKRIVVVFPPNRFNNNLAQVADDRLHVWRSALMKCQLPDQVTKKNGTILHRPAEWC